MPGSPFVKKIPARSFYTYELVIDTNGVTKT